MNYAFRLTVAREMIAILISRGYTHHLRLFQFLDDAREYHQLPDFIIRRLIHEAKSK